MLNSRRNLKHSPNVHLMVMHPSYVTIPTPPPNPLESPRLTRGRKRVPFRTGYSSSKSQLNSPLLTDMLPKLTDLGLLAATTRRGEGLWTGIARLPNANEERGPRLVAIKRNEGIYRKVDIK
jgi:hypothetical protein